ncbi:MAG: DUF3305 domain-containing protein [Burkholderiaceae bacterium]
MNSNPETPPDKRVPMQDGPELLARVPVSVLMQITPTPEHRWLSESLQTLAVIPADAATATATTTIATGPVAAVATPKAGDQRGDDEPRLIRHDGLILELHPDEAESYYLNLMVENPRCFVVFDSDDSGRPLPFLVTPSFDLATSYEENDRRVDSVPLDSGLYSNVEAFVLNYYVPEKVIKRKRRNWSEK